MNCLNVREYNIRELIYEGELFSSDNNLFNGVPKSQKKGKLGFTNFRGENIPGFTIAEMECMFYEDLKISSYISEPVLSLHFMTEGTSALETKNSKTIVALKGTGNIWGINGDYFGHQTFKKDMYSSSTGIYIHSDYLEELTNRYPDLLSKAYRKCMNGETFSLNKEYRATTLEMVHIISQIKHAKLMGNVSDIYTEAKILELLALQLQQDLFYCRDTNHKHGKKKFDVEKIYEAKRILLSDINAPPSIKELSRIVGSNEYKLKRGFKEVYNQTIYGCLFEYKMELAQKLLLDTGKTILEIAFECGYDHASHFTTAFKRKYGMNPREYRSKA